MKKSGMVTIITVNYNGWRDTCAMIDSLWQHEPGQEVGGVAYEVIVVDNASAGDDADRIEAHLAHRRQQKEACSRVPYPEVTLLRSQTNRGFAGGNNLAIPHAKGDYLFFLNNDTEIQAPVLPQMVERLESDATIGALSPLIRFAHTPDEVQYAGDWRLTPITLRNRCPDADLPNRHLISRPVEVLHGAAMMLRRDVVEQIGPMYEGYFLFYEEFDWSYAVLRAGYQVWFEASAVIYHKEGKTIGLRTPLRERYLVRSRLLFAHRWVPFPQRWLTYLYLLGPVTLRNVLHYALHGQWGLLKATLQGLKCW